MMTSAHALIDQAFQQLLATGIGWLLGSFTQAIRAGVKAGTRSAARWRAARELPSMAGAPSGKGCDAPTEIVSPERAEPYAEPCCEEACVGR
jgi:hypothetical protein